MYYILLFVVFFFLPSLAVAHGPGEPPMFLVNGKYSDYYHVQANTTVFTLPQDIAPETYLVNTPITFELDIEELANSIPEEILNKTKYSWDFGDGTNGEGVTNTHSYAKAGSYLLSILGEYEQGGSKVSGQVIQTIMLHVLPNKDYNLPRAIIKANGKEANSDALNDPISVNLRQYVNLDGSSSQAPSNKIISYLWDFGNEKSGTDRTVLYKYDDSVLYVAPVLRVTDENGFIADGYTSLIHDPNVVNQTSSGSVTRLSESQSDILIKIVYFTIGGVFMIGIFVLLRLLFKK